MTSSAAEFVSLTIADISRVLWLTEAPFLDSAAPAPQTTQTGISNLAVRIRTLIHRSPSRTARFLRRTFFQLPIPVAQPALELEPEIPGPFSDTSAPLGRFFAGFPRSAVARYSPGTGSAQILRSMSPNSRRVRCPSASRSQ